MQNKRIIPGVCERCGTEFLGFRSSQARFCSKSCSARTCHGSVADRFTARLDKDGPMPEHGSEFGNCWPFTGTTAMDGYARCASRPAHVIAWELASGCPVPHGLKVLHVCDFRRCVRNDIAGIYVVGDRVLPRFGHLALGTPKDNLVDASLKGRCSAGAYRRAATKPESYRRGEAHHRAVLTMDQARAIRRRYAAGGIIKRELATSYSVSVSTIKNVLAGKAYPE